LTNINIFGIIKYSLTIGGIRLEKLSDYKIATLYAMEQSALIPLFKGYDKEQLILFAEREEIPVKTYHTRNKIAEHLATQVFTTGMYRRIAKVDKKE
jgi:hypothetical protein